MGAEIKYQIKKNSRARRMRVAVYCDGSVVATAPPCLSQNFIENWIHQKADWILGKIKYFEKKGLRPIPTSSRGEYKKFKETARRIAKERLEYFSKIYGIQYNKISIRNQKTRWGSCSVKGNLNFNYKIALLPPESADYIIVHELCHLRHFNHSQDFWQLVSQAIPDYKRIRREIRKL